MNRVKFTESGGQRFLSARTAVIRHLEREWDKEIDTNGWSEQGRFVQAFYEGGRSLYDKVQGIALQGPKDAIRRLVDDLMTKLSRIYYQSKDENQAIELITLLTNNDFELAERMLETFLKDKNALPDADKIMSDADALKVLSEKLSEPPQISEPPQWLDMFTKYAMKDSGNRVQMLMNQIEINMDAPIREYFKEQFGEEAGILLTEIMEGLNEQEQERLATGPKRKVKKPEMSVETIQIEEPSLPEAENEDELLASLDFLDADIDEMLSLEELEDELNLDDLNLD